MDGVILKPGWLNRGNSFGGAPHGEMYRQSEAVSGLGGSQGGQWGGFGRPAAIGMAASPVRPASSTRTTSSRSTPAAASRPLATGLPRPSPPVVIAPATGWGPQAPRPAGKAALGSGLPLSKVAPPPTAVRSAASSAPFKPGGFPAKPSGQPPLRAGGVAAVGVGTSAKIAGPSVAQQGGGPGPSEEASRQRRAKLEQRRRFLEDLASGKGEADSPAQEPEPEEDTGAGGGDTVTQSLAGPAPVAVGPGDPEAPGGSRGAGGERREWRQEWDAKWRAMYGSFVDVGQGWEPGDEGEEAEGGDESLLTEEELAAFRAAYGVRSRGLARPRVLLAAGWRGSLRAGPSLMLAEAEAETSEEEDSDAEGLPARLR